MAADQAHTRVRLQDIGVWARAHSYRLVGGLVGALVDADHLPAFLGLCPVLYATLGDRPLHVLVVVLFGGLSVLTLALLAGWAVCAWVSHKLATSTMRQ